MNIRETFLALTSKTYPYGYEDELVSFLPNGYEIDEHGNYFYKIGESKTVFTCHLDTACKNQVDVVHCIDGNIIKTNGKSILGADDKAGMTIILYMISKNVPGLYYFFIGEEVGCIGSSLSSRDPKFKKYSRIVSFDRRGTESIITHQSSKRCCSDEFSKQLSKEYGKFGMIMKPDNTGIYTDSAEFVDVISECTNISVGYYREHTHEESQDINHLAKLANASVKVNWESLTSKRDPQKIELKKEDYSNYSAYGYNTYNGYGYNSRHNRHNSYNRNSTSFHGRSTNVVKTWPPYDDEEKQYSKRRKRSKCRKSKVYLDSLENDITHSFPDMKSKNYYENFKQILLDDKITKSEFEVLKDQYLNLNIKEDSDFFIAMNAIFTHDKLK